MDDAIYDHPEYRAARFRRFAYDYAGYSRKYFGKTTDQADATQLLNMTIAGHLYVEQMINHLLRIMFPEPDGITRFTFSQKITVLTASRVLAPDMILKIRTLNKLRNNFAHNISFQPTLEHVTGLIDSSLHNDWNEQQGAAVLDKTLSGMTWELHSEILRVELAKAKNTSIAYDVVS